MKLNSPWKALLWEEMCVAVAVVATILLTVFIICSFLFAALPIFLWILST
jgi:hypothetical protein